MTDPASHPHPLPPSPNTPNASPPDRFVTVNGLRLHYLEWGGGDGEPLVLVPGTGQSAHVFGEVAPRLAAGGVRVVGLSPHGHGPSETPGRGYRVGDFASEVAAFLDALGIARAGLGAHSLAGSVITHCAVARPERVGPLVYLDAVYDYTRWGAMHARNPVRPPPPPLSARDSEDDERAWLERYYYGYWAPALDADWRVRPSRAESARRRDLFSELVDDAVSNPAPYGRLRAPALALLATETVRSVYPWLEPGDAARREEAARFLREMREPWRRGAVERFRRETPDGRVVEAGTHHHLFVADAERVAGEVLRWMGRAGQVAGGGTAG